MRRKIQRDINNLILFAYKLKLLYRPKSIINYESEPYDKIKIDSSATIRSKASFLLWILKARRRDG